MLIISANANDHITKKLASAAESVLQQNSMSYKTITVPGSLEIPAAISFAERSNQLFDGYVALGCIIKHETMHYDYVASSVIHSLVKISYKYKLAIGCGIITALNEDQAKARSEPESDKNYGSIAAKAALEMLKLKRQFI